MAVMVLPEKYRKRLRTTNMQERLNEEEKLLPVPSLEGVTDPNEAARIYMQIMRGGKTT